MQSKDNCEEKASVDHSTLIFLPQITLEGCFRPSTESYYMVWLGLPNGKGKLISREDTKER